MKIVLIFTKLPCYTFCITKWLMMKCVFWMWRYHSSTVIVIICTFTFQLKFLSFRSILSLPLESGRELYVLKLMVILFKLFYRSIFHHLFRNLNVWTRSSLSLFLPWFWLWDREKSIVLVVSHMQNLRLEFWNCCSWIHGRDERN